MKKSDATCYMAYAGLKKVYLVQDADNRWLMYVRGLKPKHRRKDFASPFLGHAMRTAEAWFGILEENWRRQAAVKPEGEGEPTRTNPN